MENNKKKELLVAYVLVIVDLLSQITSILRNFGHAQIIGINAQVINIPLSLSNFVNEIQPFRTFIRIRSFYNSPIVLLPFMMVVVDFVISIYCIKKAMKICPKVEINEKKIFKKNLLIVLSIINMAVSLIAINFFSPMP